MYLYVVASILLLRLFAFTVLIYIAERRAMIAITHRRCAMFIIVLTLDIFYYPDNIVFSFFLYSSIVFTGNDCKFSKLTCEVSYENRSFLIYWENHIKLREKRRITSMQKICFAGN